MTVPNDRRWRKSTKSAGQDTCVEVRNTLDEVRDSKNPSGPVLAAAGLIAAVKAGKLDR